MRALREGASRVEAAGHSQRVSPAAGAVAVAEATELTLRASSWRSL